MLGPDLIDPRQLELIRHQAEIGDVAGVRDLPEVPTTNGNGKVTTPKAEIKLVETDVDPQKAERMKKREAALARKRAREAAAKEENEG